MNAPMTKHEIVAAGDVNALTHTLRSELMANAVDSPAGRATGDTLHGQQFFP